MHFVVFRDGKYLNVTPEMDEMILFVPSSKVPETATHCLVQDGVQHGAVIGGDGEHVAVVRMIEQWQQLAGVGTEATSVAMPELRPVIPAISLARPPRVGCGNGSVTTRS